MQSLVNLLIIICLLYVLYRVVGQYILPIITRRRLDRYKRKFFEENPHIDEMQYERKKQNDEENAPLWGKRRNYRI
ncbi:MAG: hypothetical protein MJZ62_00785 [Bacteroidales bacterium]|nr:hypothetical protein [Bacteroidales bacterium]